MAQNFLVTDTLPLTGCMPQDVVDLFETSNPTAALVGEGLKVQANQIMLGDRVANWRKYTKTRTDLSAAALTNNIELFSLPAGGVIHAVRIKHSAPFTGGSIATYNLSVGVGTELNRYVNNFNAFQAVTDAAYRIVWAPLFDSLSLATMSSLDGAIAACITQADGAISGLPIAAAYSQTEIQNFRTAAETLMDNVRALAGACETLGDDVRSMHAKLAALFNGTGGTATGNTSIRLKADSTGGNLSTATSGSVDVYVLWSLAQ